MRAKHPLRLVRVVVNEVLSRLDGDFAKAYAIGGRPSNAPERLLRALLLWPEGEFRTAAGESLAIPIPRRAALARLSRSKNLTYQRRDFFRPCGSSWAAFAIGPPASDFGKARQRSKSGARSFPEGRLRPLG